MVSDATMPSAAPTGGAARIVSVAATGDATIDGLMSGAAWLDTPSFGFPALRSDYEADYGGVAPDSGFAQASFAQIQAVRQVLTGSTPDAGGPVMHYGSIASFTLLNPGEVQSPGTADLRYAQSTSPATAYTYTPWAAAGDGSAADPTAGDVWFGKNYPALTSPQPGNYGWAVILHETGHALGLKHTGEATGPGGIVFPAGLDSLEHTVMSGRSLPNGSPGLWTNEASGYPQTYMPLDIAALQHLYGANFEANAGDTTYGWSPDTGEIFIDGVGQGTPSANRIFLTIWDGGGTDTYDLSNYVNGVTIDLQPGASSAASAAQLAVLDAAQGIRAAGNIYNALLFEGDPRSLIENATGGSGDDSVTGNAAGNRLLGNGGNDTLFGLDGDDTLQGGPGDDVLDGGAGADTFIFDLSSETVAGTAAPGASLFGLTNALRDPDAGGAGWGQHFAKLTAWWSAGEGGFAGSPLQQWVSMMADHGRGPRAAPDQILVRSEGSDTITHFSEGDVLRFDLPRASVEPHVTVSLTDADGDGAADTELRFDGGGGITLLDTQYASLAQLAEGGRLQFATDAAVIA